MKRFNITVNGKAYDVAVEELDAGPAPLAPVAPAATAAPTAPAAPIAPAASGTPVKAPMPGLIVNVKVNVGDTVKSGQPVVILEAMKMENDVVAPVDGTITSVAVKKGDNVGANAVLVTIG